MTGIKTNEIHPSGETTPGARAKVSHVRTSAYKAREVLNLIRGEQVATALEILEFSERDIATVILKCLESAIANAENNNGLPADELYVSACYADEGPTLKRWRPRARGRATRIRKRTTHITILVNRLPEERLTVIRESEVSSGAARGNRGAAEARRQRVLRSRSEKAERKAAEEEEHDHDHEGHDHDGHDHGDEPVAETEVSAADVAEAEEAEGIVDQTAAGVAAAEAAETEATDDEATDDEPSDEPGDDEPKDETAAGGFSFNQTNEEKS
jgi:large subunit ribosomal protein L22